MTGEKSDKSLSWLNRHKRLIIGIGTVILILTMIYIVDFISLGNKILMIGLLN